MSEDENGRSQSRSSGEASAVAEVFAGLDAERAAAHKPYRPSNGTEGDGFQAVWCGNCKRDAAYRANPDAAEGCPILASTMAYSASDPGYPAEWRYIDGKPICTAYDESGLDAEPSARDRLGTIIDQAFARWTGRPGQCLDGANYIGGAILAAGYVPLTGMMARAQSDMWRDDKARIEELEAENARLADQVQRFTRVTG